MIVVDRFLHQSPVDRPSSQNNRSLNVNLGGIQMATIPKGSLQSMDCSPDLHIAKMFCHANDSGHGILNSAQMLEKLSCCFHPVKLLETCKDH
jgi:hypothetical protein